MRGHPSFLSAYVGEWLGRPRDAAFIEQGRNRRWLVDFLLDVLVNGRRFRIFAVFDDFTRECLALTIDTSIYGRAGPRASFPPAPHRPRPRARKVNPGRVFDLELPLADVEEGYRAMDERQAVKVMLRV